MFGDDRYGIHQNIDLLKKRKSMQPIIIFGKSNDAWSGYTQFLKGLIKKNQVKSICDVGGGANPIFDLEYLVKQDIKYTLLDISAEELNKAPEEYHKIQADISAPELSIDLRFDLIVSKMLAEHIKDAAQFHKNILSILNKSGFAVHFFPTLYTLPFVVNRLIPESLPKKIIKIFCT